MFRLRCSVFVHDHTLYLIYNMNSIFTRGDKYGVKRHINSLHDGVGNIVSLFDYIAGRRQGYFPNPILVT